jgi:hypothetical protein
MGTPAEVRGGERGWIENSLPLHGPLPLPEQIGEVVLHLATAEYTTGLDYLCTGGAELGYARKVRAPPQQ